MRLRSLSLVLFSFLLLLPSQAQDNPVNDKNFIPIKDIVNVVENALDTVKAQLQPTDPQLTTAEFDFQTVSTKDTTLGVIASIVTVEAEHKKIATQETDFVYSVPDKAASLLKLQRLKSLKRQRLDLKSQTDCTQDVVSIVSCLWNDLTNLAKPVDPEQLASTLPGAIVAAAQAARNVSKVRNSTGLDLPHRQIVITLTYQVNNSFSGGADASKLISVGPEAKYSDETDRTQTLKLTFEDPKK